MSETLKKGTMVELESTDLGKQEFEVQHATNILNLPQNGGAWKLPANSKFEHANGKIIPTTGKGTTPTT